MSMKPGVTVRPLASITRSAAPTRPGATATTRSPSTATSAARAGAPLPSTTVPPRISRDQATSGFLDGHRRHPVALLDAIDVLHAVHHLAEHGVVVVEVRRGPVGDVELAAGRVGVLAAGHRHRAAQVLLLVELGLDLVAGPAGAIALGAAPLHHEVGDDPVKGEAVVEPLLGERHEVLDRLRRVLGEEFDADLLAGVERDDRGLLHGCCLLYGSL